MKKIHNDSILTLAFFLLFLFWYNIYHSNTEENHFFWRKKKIICDTVPYMYYSVEKLIHIHFVSLDLWKQNS